ncbi:SPL11 [Scenedesmus sp. PABB004]|nr:SPL11 [Scenedesmus sp. PABB004]
MERPAWATALAAGAALAAVVVALAAAAWRERGAGDDDDDDDGGGGVPEEYRDPITFELMAEPVILVATGMVYDRASLARWFAAGHHRCPRTNVEVVDAQVARLPWLRAAIADWAARRGRPPPAEGQPSLAAVGALHADIGAAVRALRGSSSPSAADVAALARALQRWQDGSAGDGAAAAAQAAVRRAVVDDMAWLVRYGGDPELQAMAASVLNCCDDDDELAWLAATSTVPLVAMLQSSSSSAQQWSLQVLYKIALRVASAGPLLQRAGAVGALLRLVSLDRDAVPFHRDRAAVALARLAEQQPGVDAWLRHPPPQEHGLVPLMGMLLNSPDRYEQRDAAFALLSLAPAPEDLELSALAVRAAGRPARPGQQEPVPAALLRQRGLSALGEILTLLRWSSQAYLAGAVRRRRAAAVRGRGGGGARPAKRSATAPHAAAAAPQADAPDGGLTAEERAARESYKAELASYRQSMAAAQAGQAAQPVAQQQQQQQQEQAEPPQQRQQQQEEQPQPQQRAPPAHGPALDDAQQGQRPPLRRRRGQPQHWMDADGGEDDGGGGAPEPLLGGSSSSDGSLSSSDESDESGGRVG